MKCLCRKKLIKWGQTKTGRTRWRCPSCGHTGVRQPSGYRHNLIKQYLIQGKTVDVLSVQFKVHANTIRNRLGKYLDKPPPHLPLSQFESPCWLMTDATHFKRWGCLFVTKAVGIKYPLAVSFHQKESYEATLSHLESIKHLSVTGYTTDGRSGLVLAYQQLFPKAHQQRCLVHITMRVQTLLTLRPKLIAGQELLQLTRKLTLIKTTNQAHDWWVLIQDWETRWLPVLKERSYQRKRWWYTHKNLRQAWRHIFNAADHLFVFLDHPTSTWHTNCLEGTFSQKKPLISRHRGMSRHRIANAVLWIFYLISRR